MMMSPNLPTRTTDLTYAYCWVCSEEEFRDPSSAFLQSSSSVDPRSSFIHPCKCSLVAHEKCLLSWIRQCNKDKPGQPIVCPQCKTPYQLEQPQSVMLGILERVRRLVRSTIPLGVSMAAVSGAWVAATAHGCLSIRLLLGQRAAHRTLAGPWPWHYWLDLPLIPFILVASRLPFLANFTTWLPTLVAMPLTGTAVPMHGGMMLYRQPLRVASQRRYPPNPLLITLLLPWIRVLYMTLKRHINYYLLKSPSRRPRPPRSQQGDTARQGTRMVIMGEYPGAGQLVDANPDVGAVDTDTYETLDDGTLVQNIGGDRGVFLEDLEQEMFETDELPSTIYVTYYSLSKLIVQSLAFPFICNLSGGFLAVAAKHVKWLRTWLGIAPGIVPETDFGFWWNLVWPQDPMQTLSRERYELDALWSDPSTTALFDELDPIWYRNMFGGGLYIVLKDSLVLLYQYLRKKQRQQLRIKDFPFSEGVARELALQSARRNED